MKNFSFFTIIIISTLMLACSVASFVSTPPTPVVIVVTQLVAVDTAQPQPAATDVPAAPPAAASATPADLSTSTTAPAPTSSVPMVRPLKDPVNCRFGPSVNFEQVAALDVDTFAQVTGQNAGGSWLQVQIPTGSSPLCWVSTSVVVITGDMSGLMTLPPPAGLITDVKFQIKSNTMTLDSSCSGEFLPFKLDGSISVNGPLDVTWHIETEQDGTMPSHTFKFSKFGTQDITTDYFPSIRIKGDYWVRLVISSPQNMYQETTYQVICR